MNRLWLGVSCAAGLCGSAAGGAVIVNVDARDTVGVSVTLGAGRYTVRSIGPAEGGAYTAWNAWGTVSGCAGDCGCSTGWMSSWGVRLTPLPGITSGDAEVCATPELALASSTVVRCFALDEEQVVVFYVRDTPLFDNLGGYSVLVEQDGVCPDDCNDNGFSDDYDIVNGLSDDADGDGVPDECTLGCNAADLAEPFGLLDLADVTAFVTAFTMGDLLADLDGSGLLDLADVTLFVSDFVAGCP